MGKAYHCPNCKTNRTRFNIIRQEPSPVKIDANTGEILTEYSEETIVPHHLIYKGPAYKIQCGICGLLENEEMFVSYAKYLKREHSK